MRAQRIAAALIVRSPVLAALGFAPLALAAPALAVPQLTGPGVQLFADPAHHVKGLTGSYINKSLRSVDSPDWRSGQVVAATRVDTLLQFTRRGWGARAAVNLTWGTDADWDKFSVQWDGYVQVSEPGTRLATVSDECSRMWIDLDGDGAFASARELTDNAWGYQHTATQGQIGRASCRERV